MGEAFYDTLVVVTVKSGRAEIAYAPKEIDVHIVDFDNLEGYATEVPCPACGAGLWVQVHDEPELHCCGCSYVMDMADYELKKYERTHEVVYDEEDRPHIVERSGEIVEQMAAALREVQAQRASKGPSDKTGTPTDDLAPFREQLDQLTALADLFDDESSKAIAADLDRFIEGADVSTRADVLLDISDNLNAALEMLHAYRGRHLTGNFPD